MKKNILKVSLVAAFALFAGYNVYSSQESDVMSYLVLANVEALANGSGAEGGGGGGGIDWQNYYLDADKGCCKRGRYSDICSGRYSTCDIN